MKRHRSDPVSLVAGLAFLGAAGLWVTVRVATIESATVGVIVAGGLLLLGALGLVYTVVSIRRSR